MVFDIGIAQSRPSHSSLITVAVVPSSLCLPPPALYTSLWSMFQPDIVIDPIAGMMYQLKIKCNLAKNEIEDKCTLIEFLMNRNGQKVLVLSTLAECLKTKSLTLRQTRKLFNILTEKYSLSLSNVVRSGEASKCQLIPCDVEYLRIEQKELQSSLFIPLMEDSLVDKKYMANTMLQYLRSLHRSNIPVEAYFLELLVGSLASAGEMAKLHQLVTYRVISDSKPLAFLLLSYEARCPSLFQSGVDVLARQKASDEIVEVLLERGHVVDAIRYLEAQSSADINNLKIMEAAARKDRVVQHAVFSYFQNKKGKDDLALFSKQSKILYDQDEVMEAEREVATAVQFD